MIDATTGQNGLRQAQAFAEAVDVTGVVLTKLDGTAKGGIALAIAGELGIPVKLIGVGEGIEDLRPFDAEEFAARAARRVTMEIERKFLVDDAPDLEQARALRDRAGLPGARRRGRWRRGAAASPRRRADPDRRRAPAAGPRGGGARARRASAFERLWRLTEGRRLTKRAT